MKKIHRLHEFQQIARDFALGLTSFPNRATVVGLYGDLGSGKTTFVQDAAKALGARERLVSPTFLIVKSYKLKVKSFKTLVHIDAYRLKHSDELLKLRFEELLRDPGNLIFLEWADRVADVLPRDHIKISLSLDFLDERARRIAIG